MLFVLVMMPQLEFRQIRHGQGRLAFYLFAPRHNFIIFYAPEVSVRACSSLCLKCYAALPVSPLPPPFIALSLRASQ